jgi:hypothetical protein
MGGPLGHAPKRNVMLIGHPIHLFPRIKQCGLFCEHLGVLKILWFRDGRGFCIVLERLIGIFEFQTIRQREKIPALMKECPKVCTIAPSDFL